ncbi:MAG: antitoxin [Glaciihabitans sp.]|nr:antitoxin [Glaciihabitans sp.]
MPGLGDLGKKAQGLLGDKRVKDALGSQKAEDISDKLLDSGSNAAKKASGGKFDSQIDGARDQGDKHVGNQ